jgi:hypothetical protein
MRYIRGTYSRASNRQYELFFQGRLEWLELFSKFLAIIAIAPSFTKHHPQLVPKTNLCTASGFPAGGQIDIIVHLIARFIGPAGVFQKAQA